VAAEGGHRGSDGVRRRLIGCGGRRDGETAGERFDRRADQDRVIFRKPFDIKSC